MFENPVELSSSGFFHGALMFKVSAQIKGKFNSAQMTKQFNFATAKALTEVAQLVKVGLESELKSKLDRPTPFTMKSLFIKPATRQKLEAFTGLKNASMAKSSGAAADIFKQHFFGGARNYKRMEGAFKRNGMLKDGQIIVPGKAAELDAYGNLKKSLIVTLLSYFKAFGEQGYKANATDESKRRRAKFTKVKRTSIAGKKYKSIGGVVYFYSAGPGLANKRPQHLPAGIWQKKGIHGVDVSPVLLFVKPGVYSQRFDLEELAKTTHAKRFMPLLETNFAKAMATAR